MKYCRRCAADLEGANVCPVCGTEVVKKEVVYKEQPIRPKEEQMFNIPPKEKDPMDTIKKVVLIGIVLVVLYFAISIIFFPYESPPQNVKFSGPLTQGSALGYPRGVSGNIMAVPENAQPIDVSKITFAVDGIAIENRQTYNFADVVDNYNGATLSYGQSVEFYLLLPEFKEQVVTSSRISITYDVYVYYNGEYNDNYEFNVDYLYE